MIPSLPLSKSNKALRYFQFSCKSTKAKLSGFPLKLKTPLKGGALFDSSAEKVGFEPTIPLRVYKLSRLALSATQTPLRIGLQM